MRCVKGCLAILLTCGPVVACEKDAPQTAQSAVPWAGARVEGRPSHCLNLITRPDNRRVERWKDGERLDPLRCGRARCMTGSKHVLARYDGDDLVLEVGDREPIRIGGARISEVQFMFDGAFVVDREAATLRIAHRSSALHGRQWKLEGLAADERVASVEILDTGVVALVGRNVDCEFVDKRRLILAGEPDDTSGRLVLGRDRKVVGHLERRADGWTVNFLSGETVPIPDEVGVDEFTGGTLSHGWLYVRGLDGTFTYKAGMPPKVWVAGQVASSRAGPRALENEGVILAMDETEATRPLLDAKPRHDLMGRPLSPGVFVERRAHHFVGDGVSLWSERLRNDACVQTSRLYRVDLATGNVEQIAEKEGSLTTPFVYRDTVHWIESDIRYEMVGLQ